MGLGDTAGILFKIKADGSQAQGELKEMLASVAGLDGALSGVAGPAGLATDAIGAITVAAATAVVGLTKLAISASEYGSAIFDAKEKTGLSAETLSALRVAADNAGSSFDGIANGIAKFNVLLGQANQGNEKAAATLAKYGVTATDAGEALQQAFDAIEKSTNKNTAAAELFKDRTGQLLPVIKQLGGSLKSATEDAKRLGLTLSEEDVKAADDLGDALGVLSAQTKAAASRFALQYAPQITAAIQTISDSLADNSGSWASWGRDVYNFVTGAKVIVESFGTAVNNTMTGITFGLGNQLAAWLGWAGAVRTAAMVATSGLSEVLILITKIGAFINGATGSAQGEILPEFGGQSIRSTIGGKFGGSGRGGGGGGGGGGAKQDTEFADFQKKQAALLEMFRARTARQVAINELALQQMEISEVEFVERVNKLKMLELAYEAQLMQESLDHYKATAKDKEELEDKLRLMRIKQSTQEIQNVKDLEKAEAEALDKAAANIAELDKLQEEAHQRQKKRLDEIKKKRQDGLTEFLAWQRDQRKEMDPFGLGSRDKTANGDIQWSMSDTDQFLTGIGTALGLAEKQLPLLKQLGQDVAGVFMQLGNAIGSVVRNFILFGSAGTTFRKFTAEILASIAQQATVKAIFELAEGFAALFVAPPKAAAHFKAAALYGAVAVAAGVAGRVVAGNSFNESAGAATGGNTGVGQGQSQNNNYTTAFGGYGSPLGSLIERQTVVLGQVEETVHQFNTKVTTMPPDHVVALGAAGASRDIRDAYESELSSDPAATENFMRRAGLAR